MLDKIEIAAKICLLIIVSLILLATPTLSAITTDQVIETETTEGTPYLIKKIFQDLYLLHGEIAFYIHSFEDVNSFNINYSIPSNYEDQAPIYFEIRNDTTAEILDYMIVNDTNQPNRFIKFSIGPMDSGETSFIHFDFWVLVKNNHYNRFPEYVTIPKENQLPEKTKVWLESTKAIQSNNLRIKLKALKLKGRDDNLIEIAEKIVDYTSTNKFRKKIWFLANFLSPNKNGWAKYLDAVSSIFYGGSCTGRANLGTALFRANGVPAKNLIVMSTWSKEDWYDMHYICEYYCPNYGWVSAETTLGYTPYQPKNYIILRVCYPKDENEAGNRFHNYGGCEQWFWVDQKNIQIHTNEDSGAKGWIEQDIITDLENASSMFNLTQDVYSLFSRYSGENLTAENLMHYNNAVLAQKNAINCFNQSDTKGYLNNMTNAYEEYIKIE